MNPSNLEPRGVVNVEVTSDELRYHDLMSFVADERAGATVLFSGTVRDHSPGREGVSRLEYEVYDEVVIDKIGEVVREAQERWPILRVAAVHRTGELMVGESAVVVAVSTAHRSDAFPAARYIIDELKTRAPIWKKEHWPGGAEWVREDLHHTDHRYPTTDD
jgi:molybdopterin synthase catalytic subunit